MFALMSYVFTLAAVGFLLLPALWVVSWVASIKTWLPPVIGGVLASLIFGVWDYLNWCSSGVDSGPPATTFPQWIAKSSHTPEPFVAILFGVVTGAAYYCLATRKPVQSKEPMP